MGSVLDRLLEELERDPEGTKKLAEKLLSSLLHHEIRQIREELSKAITLSDESARSFQAELVKLREDFNRMLREMSQRFEAHDKKFDEIVKRLEEHDKKFDEIVKRLEEHDKKFDEIVKRLEEHDKKFITLEEQMNKGFENTERYFRYLASTLEDIKRSIGISLEYYTSHFIEVLLKEKGFKDFTVNAHVNLFNPVNKAFKEIDILCIEPLVVGEVTTVLNSVKKAEEELNKLLDNAKFAEELFGKSSFMKLLAVENAPQEVFDYLKSKSKELGITLITGKEIK
jgi:DNA repair ATPase RecN